MKKDDDFSDKGEENYKRNVPLETCEMEAIYCTQEEAPEGEAGWYVVMGDIINCDVFASQQAADAWINQGGSGYLKPKPLYPPEYFIQLYGEDNNS
ncbi:MULTISPECIES: hypothetical protein [unclassified Saccharibacter]|uniref:hypothetical protein n=1 Tax=unclassified Saccharibacter TaxID=2648722 RepID=UPI0013231E53|nr:MULTISPECIES: hypothetical protein [unclassified Saccharibacter]MXV37017.1 hypothetical protein [Saccharibacter sp. EH611]MXV58493.1 hypothetical protein [Saccharibacter sp. EH70]MXV65999.1 hypothetical protein [Saccharibacter sp. EH60]